MKNIFSLVFAGIIGGSTVWGLNSYFSPENEIAESNPVVKMVNEKPNHTNSNIDFPFSFADAASIATQSVVHIKAAESDILAQQRIQDRQQKTQRNPFDGFFNMDDFFGNPYLGQNMPKKGSGSGVIISPEGYIVTNNHVVGFADELIVTLDDKREFNAKKIGVDPSTDLAVIKIEASDLPVMKTGNSDLANVGDWVLAVGNPFDYLTSTVTAGIVSAKGRDINIIKESKAIEEFIQTDAAINPGNSGGALVNTKGELIGINTAIATPTGSYAGYSFAIPSKLMTKIVNEIIETGDIERANLGVAGYDIDPELVEEFNLKTAEGFYVAKVIDGSAAQFGGIYPGDVITNVNETKIKDFDSLSEVLKFGKVGDEFKVRVNRDGAEKTIRVRLKKGL